MTRDGLTLLGPISGIIDLAAFAPPRPNAGGALRTIAGLLPYKGQVGLLDELNSKPALEPRIRVRVVRAVGCVAGRRELTRNLLDPYAVALTDVDAEPGCTFRDLLRMSVTRDFARMLHGTAHLITRPVRRARGRRGAVLQPYRGYGSRTRIFVIGRAFWQRTDSGQAVSDFRAILRRVRRRPVRGARIRARFYGAVAETETDRDGYFRIEMGPGAAPDEGIHWHRLEIAMLTPARVAAETEVYIPPAHARFVVISDIDDTVMHTGVANKVAMLWRLFVQDAKSRTVFPGVSHLYRALHAGASGNEANAMLYVSRAPWGIYEILEEFFQRHEIPVGPILFLREWGVSWRHPVPRRAEDHKRTLIAAMMRLYDDMAFVLIGDSGQRDPEIYNRIVRETNGRVRAVYIREVTARGPERAAEVAAMATALRETGGHLVLARDSLAIAEDAARLGLIAPEALEAVRARVAERLDAET